MSVVKHQFVTITGDDWRRSLAQARARVNLALREIVAAKDAQCAARKITSPQSNSVPRI